jgi:hypothetical protein
MSGELNATPLPFDSGFELPNKSPTEQVETEPKYPRIVKAPSEEQSFTERTDEITEIKPVTDTDERMSDIARRVSSNVVILPTRTRVPRPSIAVLAQWEGTVSEVADDEFVADLRDLLGLAGRVVTRIALDEVSRNDQSLVQPGAVFDWVVAKRSQPYGTQETVNTLTFRRLPAWSEMDERKGAKIRGRYDVLFTDE